ncbi:MAG: flagellar hook-basal body complex protein FliE [Clostridia bacterium]|nr:flagellar hook-basal body complex protein FliE [Clostridia bacterium]
MTIANLTAIGPVSNLVSPQGVANPQNQQSQQGSAPQSFLTALKDAWNQVNYLQEQADQVTQAYLAGQIQDVHQVMIATEEANLALQLTVQIRNKIIEAYQEVSRMQI